MGMFDEVLCNHTAFGIHQGETHQTKSLHPLGGALEKYEITPSGRLEFLEYRTEDRSDPNAQGIWSLGGSMAIIFTGKRRDMNFHGWLELSCFGRAKFTDGTIVGFEQEADMVPSDHELSDVGTANDQIQAGETTRISMPDHGSAMKVSELIDWLRAFDLNADVHLQIDSRRFATPVWVGIMDTAGLFDEEKDFQLVISAWEPAEYLCKSDK
jgi:hypothetical protein